jgi:hypothetical protein
MYCTGPRFLHLAMSSQMHASADAFLQWHRMWGGVDPEENRKTFYNIGVRPISTGCPVHIQYFLCESEEQILIRKYLLLFRSDVHRPASCLKALKLISKKHITSRVECYGCETQYFILWRSEIEDILSAKIMRMICWLWEMTRRKTEANSVARSLKIFLLVKLLGWLSRGGAGLERIRNAHKFDIKTRIKFSTWQTSTWKAIS